MQKRGKKAVVAYRGGWSKAGYLLIIIAVVPLLFWGTKVNRTQYRHTVVFADDNMSDYENKWMYANANRDYWILESEFMTRYSYPTDVVFVGDSITYRCQWNEIFPELDVKNRGIPSDTTGGVCARIDSIIKTKPGKVFIMIGINDLGADVEEEEIMNNYYSIVDSLLEVPDIRIYVESVLPVNENSGISKENIIELNGYIEKMCSEKGIEYIDLYSIFSDHSGWLADQYSMDGVHINAKGYECWKNQIRKYIY